MCGDLNSILSCDERVRAPVRQYEMESMRAYLLEYGLHDLSSLGITRKGTRVFSKINRVLLYAK